MTRVALVTGAARGIGAATVLALAAADWAVVAVDRASNDPRLPYSLGTEEDLRSVVVSTGSEDVIAHLADTTDPAAMGAAVARAEDRFGGLDAVITAAGVIAGGVPLWEMPEAEMQAVVDIDLGGPLTAARMGIPALLRRPRPREGRFIGVASTAATRGLPGLAAYGAAKAGVAGLIRGLAVDLRGTGVTAVGVSPGSTATHQLDESARLYGLPDAQAFAAQVPVERLLAPEEIARTIVWLAGADTGGITGAVVVVDGGLSL
jgi:SDR family mycofactocin-dependent oxidoreductase